MNAPRHLVMNAALAVPAQQVFDWSWGIVFTFILAGVLIDIDHPIYFSVKHRTINPKKWIKIGNELRDKMQANLYILHSPEFNLIILILAFVQPIFLVLLISNLAHIYLDALDHYKFHRDFKWFKRWSLLYHLKGLRPKSVV